MWNWLFNIIICFLLPLYQMTNAVCPLCITLYGKMTSFTWSVPLPPQNCTPHEAKLSISWYGLITFRICIQVGHNRLLHQSRQRVNTPSISYWVILFVCPIIGLNEKRGKTCQGVSCQTCQMVMKLWLHGGHNSFKCHCRWYSVPKTIFLRHICCIQYIKVWFPSYSVSK